MRVSMDGDETSLHESCSMPEKVDMFRPPGKHH